MRQYLQMDRYCFLLHSFLFIIPNHKSTRFYRAYANEQPSLNKLVIRRINLLIDLYFQIPVIENFNMASV